MSTASAPETRADDPRPVPPPSPWAWMVGACILLAGSGAVRLWQEYRYQAAFENARTPPFSLREMPLEIGDWICQGGDQIIDKDTLTIAGSSDYLAREYVNETTGVSLQLLIVFGPAERVFGHSPDVCFPAVGYGLAENDPGRSIPMGDSSEPARFRSAVFSLPTGNANDERVECFWSFWHDGHWAPDAAQTRKLFRHRPNMFKVQVQRQVIPEENRGRGNPSQEFLQLLLPILQQRIDATRDASPGQGQADQAPARPA